MGLFHWFKQRSNVEVANDRIWLTKRAKLQGISSEIGGALADPNGPIVILLVAHFTDYVQALETLVQQSGFDEKTVLVAMAEDLTAHSPPVTTSSESQWIGIVVAERHPLPSHDESLAAFARAVPCRSRIVFHLSLDDPVMQLFAGGWVKQVLERLGMSENEAIESRIVACRIRRAQ